jgi:hypothetical protein
MENKPFYAKIIDKMNEEQIAGWNVEDIFEAEDLLKRIFSNPSRYYIVLIKKEIN